MVFYGLKVWVNAHNFSNTQYLRLTLFYDSAKMVLGYPVFEKVEMIADLGVDVLRNREKRLMLP